MKRWSTHPMNALNTPWPETKPVKCANFARAAYAESQELREELLPIVDQSKDDNYLGTN